MVNSANLNEHAKISFSQFGEDLFLNNLLFFHQSSGFYVDIGCHHPFRYSNTCMYYMRGWRGLNVDVDPKAIDLFNIERQEDTNVLIGVGREAGRATVYLFNDGAVNTMSQDLAKAYTKIEGRRIISEQEVPILPLSSILEAYVPSGVEIDFMSIDVEGLDFAVLQSNNWEKFRPRALIVEIQGATFENAADSDVASYLRDKGYRLEGILHLSAIFRRV
jgi:FkbM family methyltransferase